MNDDERDRSEAPPPPMSIDENLEDVEMEELDKSSECNYYQYYYHCYYLLQEIINKGTFGQPPRPPPLPDATDSDSEYSFITMTELEINALKLHLALLQSAIATELKGKLRDEYGIAFVDEIENCRKKLRKAVNYTHDGTQFNGNGKNQVIAARKKYLEFTDLYTQLLNQIEEKMKINQ